MEGGLINAEIGWVEAHFEEIGSPSAGESAGFQREAGPLRQQVGNRRGGEGLVDQGILQRPSHGLRGVPMSLKATMGRT